MENIGVAVGIVYDNLGGISQTKMSDDGTGGGIRIPSMIISQTDGKKIVNWMKTASKAELMSMVVMADFVVDKVDQVSYELWFTSTSDRGLNFIEDFAKMHADLNVEAKVSFEPHYVFWECLGCEQKYIDNDCYGAGKYCAIEASNQ
jgi:hypothetical protein